MRFVRLCAVLTVFASALVQAAESHPAVDPLRFGDSLMLQQRFREAELEYERLAFSPPPRLDRSQALQKMFDAAMATQDYGFTLHLARAWQETLGTDAAVCLPSYYEVQALYSIGNYPSVLKIALSGGCEPWLLHRNIYLRGLSQLRLRQWSQAQAEFVRIPKDSALGDKARQAWEIAPRGEFLVRKSPALAAGLNMALPGAGYFYANRPQTAVACLMVNGLFIWGTVSAIHAKEPGLAALLSLFSFGWYFGGVYGSAQAAERETQRQLNSFVRPLEFNH